MKRSGPPARRAELRGNPDTARAWERRSRAATASAAPRARRASSGPAPGDFDAGTRARARARSGGRCEALHPDGTRCTASAWHHHHRKLRHHGDHTLPNDLHVCTDCHTAIHASPWARWARATGMLLRSTDDPASVPVAVP